ncbi:transposase [Parasalinivibrio latis]|uniref:transposase n=1 Tax=Parasalinivibrio latis TaxID=2952610 RepID=UPI0030E435C1
MTVARKYQISLEATPYYHCVSRCVRRAFLCGTDEYTGKSYEHRKAWIENRIHQLSTAFAINICAYAVMSNHYHLVCHVDKTKALSWSREEVIERWRACHKTLPVMVERFLSGEALGEAQMMLVDETVESWRKRLYSLSEFMKSLNGDIAKQANQEDKCTGHFWEGQFKSQALLDEKALAAAMAYVDLNPVRAGVAKTPETSPHTSVKRRIQSLKENQQQPSCLHPFIGNPGNKLKDGIPFKLLDYLELVDWTSRQWRDDKASVSLALPGLLVRVGLDAEEWLEVTATLERQDSQLVGTPLAISEALPSLNRKRIRGRRLAA